MKTRKFKASLDYIKSLIPYRAQMTLCLQKSMMAVIIITIPGLK